MKMFFVTIFLFFNVFVNCNDTEQRHYETLIKESTTAIPRRTPYPRVHNLILYAVKGDVANNEKRLFDHVYHLFRNICEVRLEPTDIHLVRYLRKKYVTGATRKPAPVLVAIGNLTIKDEILHKRKRLRRTGVIIEHDLPREVLEAQNAVLKPLMEKYRQEGRYVLIRNGKLIVDGKKVTEIEMLDRMTYDPFSEEKYEKLKIRKFYEEIKKTETINWRRDDSEETTKPNNETNT